MIVKLEKNPRCRSCDSDDNLRSNIEYELYLDPITIDNRLWFWNGNSGYYTDIILKKIDNVYISKNAKYKITDISPITSSNSDINIDNL